jgi:leader peptidase (prepilin peptidase)/N-methyltransferase
MPFEFWYYGTIVFIISLCLGSFFNVVIYRMPLGLSVSNPPSACPKCKNFIKWYDNMPVLSWLILAGKCRNCKNPISMQYPAVELLTGVLGFLGFLATYLDLGELNYPVALRLSWLLVACVPIMAIDFKHYLIPDIIVIPGFFIAVVIAFFEGVPQGIQAIIGGVGSAFGLWFFSWIMSKALKKEAMGFGDVKLLLMLGALNGIDLTVLTLVLSSFTGIFYFLILLVLNKTNEEEKGMIPFGPFLLIGGLFCLLRGNEILEWYYDFLML